MWIDVGVTKIIEILSLDDNGVLQKDLVMAEGLNTMEGWFRRFGPKELGYDLSFPPTAIHRLIDS